MVFYDNKELPENAMTAVTRGTYDSVCECLYAMRLNKVFVHTYACVRRRYRNAIEMRTVPLFLFVYVCYDSRACRLAYRGRLLDSKSDTTHYGMYAQHQSEQQRFKLRFFAGFLSKLASNRQNFKNNNKSERVPVLQINLHHEMENV